MESMPFAGWTAAVLMLLNSLSRDPCRQRSLAIAANLAFVLYGLSAGLLPVLCLHLVLLPINLLRLLGALRSVRRARPMSGLAAPGRPRGEVGSTGGTAARSSPGSRP